MRRIWFKLGFYVKQFTNSSQLDRAAGTYTAFFDKINSNVELRELLYGGKDKGPERMFEILKIGKHDTNNKIYMEFLTLLTKRIENHLTIM